jgi:glycosyltransferase involved in cell wall biosynthesis
VRIAIFDYQVKRSNPIGGCHLRMLRALASEHDFTVFAVAFDNPCPEKIKWVRVPAPLRPLALLFLVYHVIAPILYWLYRMKTGERFDVVQMVESNLSFGTIAYTHFCHTSYLKNHWNKTQAGGLRQRLRWLDHRLHASLEARVYASTKHVLVPSKGLAGELQREFPVTAAKLRVLPNAVDIEHLRCPDSFERSLFREQLGIAASDVVFVFTALGHFERKGLPLLLEALAKVSSSNLKLLVVGGTQGLIESYRSRIDNLGLTHRVLFVGMQSDVRPYLWAADAFAFASSYETFSLAAFEAAAASLPLITPPLHGIEEIATDRKTGYIVSRTAEEFATALTRFVELPAEERIEMGRRARLAAMTYDEERFVANWRRFYGDWMSGGMVTNVPGYSVQSNRGLS